MPEARRPLRVGPTPECRHAVRELRALWQVMRKRVLLEEPACRVCGRPATTVDHIRPLALGGAPYDRSKLQALCLAHHHQKTARESGLAKKSAAARRKASR